MSANKYLTSKLILAWIEISRRIKQFFYVSDSPPVLDIFLLQRRRRRPKKFGKFEFPSSFPLLCFFHNKIRLSAGGPAKIRLLVQLFFLHSQVILIIFNSFAPVMYVRMYFTKIFQLSFARSHVIHNSMRRWTCEASSLSPCCCVFSVCWRLFRETFYLFFYFFIYIFVSIKDCFIGK